MNRATKAVICDTKLSTKISFSGSGMYNCFCGLGVGEVWEEVPSYFTYNFLNISANYNSSLEKFLNFPRRHVILDILIKKVVSLCNNNNKTGATELAFEVQTQGLKLWVFWEGYTITLVTCHNLFTNVVKPMFDSFILRSTDIQWYRYNCMD